MGGGFDTFSIPSDYKVFWLRRYSDSLGRIFLDRPRLNKDLSPIEEFQLRKIQRDERFIQCADWILNLDEGNYCTSFSNIFFGWKIKNGVVTLTDWHFQKSSRIEILKSIQGLDFELRDDLILERDIVEIVRGLNSNRIILSFRKPNRSKKWIDFLNCTHLNNIVVSVS